MKTISATGAAVAAAFLLAACNREGTQSAATFPSPTNIPQPALKVYERYFTLTKALANDSTNVVPESAEAIAKAVKGPASQNFPADVAQQADAVAQAKTIEGARKALQPLSQSMVDSLPKNNAKGVYFVVYCPMVKARWIQPSRIVRNPYMGKKMPDCGEIQK